MTYRFGYVPQHWPTFSETKTSRPLPKVWKLCAGATNSTSGRGSKAAFITWFIWRLPAGDEGLELAMSVSETKFPPKPPAPPPKLSSPAEDDNDDEGPDGPGSARLASILDTRAGLGVL